jgi:MFS family permease
MREGINKFIGERLEHFRKMASLSNTFFLYLFGWGLIVPIFNIRINDVTGSLFLSGIIFSVFGFTRIFLDPPFGLLCDRSNPKKILLASLLSYTLVFFLYTIANDFASLFAVRILHAVSCAMLWVAGWTLVRLKSRGKYAQEDISFWYTVQDIAYIIAPLIGGIIITLFSYQLAYYLASLTSLAAFIYAYFKVKSPELPVRPRARFRDVWRAFFKDKSTSIRLVLLAFFEILIVVGFYEFMPLRLQQSGLSVEEISVVYSLATTIPFIVFPVIIGLLGDKHGRKIPTAIGLLIISLGLLSYSGLVTFTQFLFYTFIIVTGDAFVALSFNAELNDMMPEGSEGGFTGIFEMMKDVAYAAGPLLVGTLSTITSITGAFTITSLVALCTILLLKGFKNF